MTPEIMELMVKLRTRELEIVYVREDKEKGLTYCTLKPPKPVLSGVEITPLRSEAGRAS